MSAFASEEDRRVLSRFSSSLADLAAVAIQPGSRSIRSTCPDGQFWLPVRGEQVIRGAGGNRRQGPFELLYYAPREAAERMADSPTLAYGLRVKLSAMSDEQRDASWMEGNKVDWDTSRKVLSLIVKGFSGNADPHELDETIAQWVTSRRQVRETPRAQWLRTIQALLFDDPSLSLLDLSRATGIVPSYLSAEFSRTQRVTISAYRRQVMLQRALSYAGEGNLNVAAIEAGFYDASHFHRVCKAELKIKPTELRQLIWPT